MRFSTLVVRSLALRVLVCVSLSLSAWNHVFAEGTAQLMPYGTGRVGMQISNIASVTAGPYRGAPSENRVRFYAQTSETFYFGIRAFDRPSAPNVPTEINVYYRILRANGTVEVGPTLIANNATTGRILSYSKALAGPNALAAAGGAGYDALTYTPTYDGEYYIEIYQSADGGTTATANQNFLLAFFDFTVADNTSGAAVNGRVYSQGWSLITYWLDQSSIDNSFTGTDNDGTGPVNVVSGYPEFSGDPTQSLLESVFYGYSADSTVSRITFHDLRPLAFVLYFNRYGTDPASSDWTSSRKSVSLSGAATTLSNGYLVFLNEPDVVFPRASQPNVPTFPTTPIRGCPGAWKILVNVSAPGDIEVLLNFDGVAGYQAGGTDRYIYAYDVSPGIAQVDWDGKDGQGNTVNGTVQFTSSARILRGRTNLPLFDAELSPFGISVEGWQPDYSVPRLYWDDSQLTALSNTAANCDNSNAATFNNNVTSAGIDESVEGASQYDNGDPLTGNFLGNRGWDGEWLDGNSPKAQPTASTTRGASTPLVTCDDFGNYRILNTWFWSQERQSATGTFKVPSGCVLPVNLLYFAVEKQGTNARLKWTTTDEVNFDHFVVERSLDGRNYTALGIVQSRHSPLESSYSFDDNISGFSGQRIYYRLRQVDIDNSFRYSRVLTLITNLNGGLVLSGLVNPVKKTVRFQVATLQSGAAAIRICDNTGRVVYQQQKELLIGTNAIELTNLPGLAPGVYLLSVEAGDQRQVAKMVVSN